MFVSWESEIHTAIDFINAKNKSKDCAELFKWMDPFIWSNEMRGRLLATSASVERLDKLVAHQSEVLKNCCKIISLRCEVNKLDLWVGVAFFGRLIWCYLCGLDRTLVVQESGFDKNVNVCNSNECISFFFISLFTLRYSHLYSLVKPPFRANVLKSSK